MPSIVLYCPVCGWCISPLQRDLGRVDFECPGCGTRTYSEFEVPREEKERWR
jgi:predicted RNA-binding Zn-ribbon protein involved in translation (DUF1610 family)